jgi:integrase
VPRIAKPSAREVTIPAADFTAALGHASLPLRMMMLLCHDCAFRAATALRMAPINYNVEAGLLSTRTKFGRAVTVPVTARLRVLLALLTHAPADSAVPFVHLLSGSKGWSMSSMQNEWKAVRLTIGRPELRFHDLRRSMAVDTLNVTRDLRVVQALLGHTNLAATFHYLDHNISHLSAEEAEAAIKGGIK